LEVIVVVSDRARHACPPNHIEETPVLAVDVAGTAP
jgi:hypothetical protein